MKIIKVFLFVMALVLALTAFTGCELPGAECTHEGYEAIRQSVIPTCTETGLSLGVYCSNCDAVIKEQEVTEARGHDKKVYVGTTATCTEAGVETWYCAFCDSNYELEVEAYGHKLAVVAEKAPTCTEAGYTAHNACAYCDYTEGKDAVEATGHTLADVEGKAATCTEEGYTAYKACECGYTEGKEVLGTIEHNYTYGVCACGAKDPEYVDYYLIGWINGADYGCQGDSANFGEYKFVDGKLTAQFTGDCYVFVKSGNLNGENVNWYLTETYVTGKEATLSVNKHEKMWIPGGVEVVFTLTVNEDGTLTLVADYHIHSFADATCIEPKTCACGATEGEALGHNLVDGVCSVCGEDLSVAPLANAVLDCSNKENRVSFSTEQQVWSQNGITLTLNRGEGTAYSDKAPLEFGSKGSLTIEGVGIKTIVIATGNTTYGTWVSNCFSGQPGVASVSAKTGTVTIVLTEAVDVFTIEYLAKQGKINTITINP